MHGPHAKLYPPAPVPRRTPLGPVALLRVLAKNPLEAWTQAHFEQPIVMGGLSIGRVALVSDTAAIRRVLMDNSQNYHKDWLQRRVLSAGLNNGLLTAEGHQWRTQRRALAPLFARRTVLGFGRDDRGGGRSGRAVARARDQIDDIAVEVTRVTLEVLERTMFRWPRPQHRRNPRRHETLLRGDRKARSVRRARPAGRGAAAQPMESPPDAALSNPPSTRSSPRAAIVSRKNPTKCRATSSRSYWKRATRKPAKAERSRGARE